MGNSNGHNMCVGEGMNKKINPVRDMIRIVRFKTLHMVGKISTYLGTWWCCAHHTQSRSVTKQGSGISIVWGTSYKSHHLCRASDTHHVFLGNIRFSYRKGVSEGSICCYFRVFDPVTRHIKCFYKVCETNWFFCLADSILFLRLPAVGFF